MRRDSSWWARRVYPHNPLYLVSVLFVLWGVHLVANVDPVESGLTTRLLFGYILMLAGSGWLVVRVGRVWEDARTILLAVLLMFTALSASYDRLCLDDPDAGALRLGAALAFSAATVEALLALLRLRLPLVYRAPFYLQLVVLFAFPAWLGRLSLDGRDADMCLGVMAYSLAAGVSLAALLPAVVTRSLTKGPNGTPWPWPFYPWSVFVFMALAMAVRSWMLSVSFSHAKGLGAAFGPYYLAPILLAAGLLLMELGLRHRSSATQRVAALVLAAVCLISFPGEHLSVAQETSLSILESQLAGPPLLACLSVVAVSFYAALRGAAWSHPVALGAVVLGSCLAPDTRSLTSVGIPATWALAAAAAWALARGTRTLHGPLLATAAALAVYLAGWRLGVVWLSENGAAGAVGVWAAVAMSLPLFCSDPLSRYLRTAAPGYYALAAPLVCYAFPPFWWDAPDWSAAVVVGVIAAVIVAHWLVERARWHLVAATWCATLAIGSGATIWIRELTDPRLQRGLAIYAGGCATLLIALAISLAKAGLVKRLTAWLFANAETAGEPGAT